MRTRSVAMAIFVFAAVGSAPVRPPGSAEKDTSASNPKPEYKAVLFGKDEAESSQKLNTLAADGWEYIGPLGNGMVAFQRPAVLVQRLRVVGTWKSDAGAEKFTIEFTRDGKIKLTGSPHPLAALFDGVKAVQEMNGNPNALSYSIPEAGKFWLRADYTKMDLAPADLEKIAGRLGEGGIPTFVNELAKVTVTEQELTITRVSGEKRVFQRVK